MTAAVASIFLREHLRYERGSNTQNEPAIAATSSTTTNRARSRRQPPPYAFLGAPPAENTAGGGRLSGRNARCQAQGADDMPA
jgi:hypothetical protein